MTATDQVTPADLDAMEARANAATEGPWEVVPRTDDEMVYEGDECSYCAQGTPLVRSEDYPAAYGHETYAMHYHAAEPHHIAAGDQAIAGTYDYEAGGILRGADTVFAAHARTDVPKLVALARGQRAQLAKVAAIAARLEASGQCEDREIAEDLRAILASEGS